MEHPTPLLPTVTALIDLWPYKSWAKTTLRRGGRTEKKKPRSRDEEPEKRAKTIHSNIGEKIENRGEDQRKTRTNSEEQDTDANGRAWKLREVRRKHKKTSEGQKEIKEINTTRESKGRNKALPNQCTNHPQFRLRGQARQTSGKEEAKQCSCSL
ncbi:hypothetical protein NC652_016111 [Populus alba x Populus x berolinensis]|nr:hypothetical protein NC652_016111 [Populus alba x Populus x berolinensis]